MQRSLFVLGLSGEEPESALGQVLLWDGMTVGTGLRRALLRHRVWAQNTNQFCIITPTKATRSAYDQSDT